MLDLEKTNPWVYKWFKEGGLHIARRSDGYWAGLRAGLITEEVMMRSIRSGGALARGRGLNN